MSSRGEAPHQSFFFKHALIQEIAYGSLLRSTRRRLHAHIARTLARRFRAQVQGRPDLLAHHYTEARLHEQAFRYWFIASQKALSQFAPGEVVLHLNRGLALTGKLPEDVELIAMEFEMRSMLGACLMVLNGPGHQDVGAAFQEAYDFCRERESLQDSFPVKFGLCRYHWATGRILQAVTEAESLLPLVDIKQDRGQYMAVHVLLGVGLWHRGESHRALQCLRKVSSCYRADQDAQLFFTYMMDFGVVARLYQALALLSMGRRQESVRQPGPAWPSPGNSITPTRSASVSWPISWLHFSPANSRSVCLRRRMRQLRHQPGFPRVRGDGQSVQGLGPAENRTARGQPGDDPGGC